jgi:hypothetical protein
MGAILKKEAGVPVKAKYVFLPALICAGFLFSAPLFAGEQPAGPGKGPLKAQGAQVAQKDDVSLLEEEMAAARQRREKEAETYRRQLEQVVTKREEDATPWEIESYVRFMPNSGARAQSGKAGLIETESSCSYEFKAWEKLAMQVSLEQEYISINNTTAVKLPAYLVGLTANVAATVPLWRFDKTYFRAEVSPSIYRGDWVFRTSSVRIPVKMMGIYQPSEKLTLILGAAVFPDFNNPVLPIAGVIYQPNDKWFFNLVPTRPSIYYSFNDRFSVFCEGDISGGEYSVNKDEYRDTILTYDEARAGLGIRYQLNKVIEASLSCGGAFNRRFQYNDSLGKVRLKNGFYSEFRLHADF